MFSIPPISERLKTTGAVKKFDVFVRTTKTDCRHVEAEGRTQEEALRSLKLEDGEVVTAVNERPDGG